MDGSILQTLEQNGGTIDWGKLIAVVGGEPNHVARAIRKRLPDIPVFVAPDCGDMPSIYINLRGFQEYEAEIAGESLK